MPRIKNKNNDNDNDNDNDIDLKEMYLSYLEYHYLLTKEKFIKRVIMINLIDY